MCVHRVEHTRARMLAHMHMCGPVSLNEHVLRIGRLGLGFGLGFGWGWLVEARGAHAVEATALVTEATVALRREERPQAHARLLLTPGPRLLARPSALHDGLPVQVVPGALLRVAQGRVGRLKLLEVGARELGLARVLVRVPLRTRARARESGAIRGVVLQHAP